MQESRGDPALVLSESIKESRLYAAKDCTGRLLFVQQLKMRAAAAFRSESEAMAAAQASG